MSYLDTAISRLEQMIDGKLRKAEPFRAIVSAVSGDMVRIRRMESVSPEAEWRARIAGPEISPGEEVLCLPVNGKPVVLGPVKRQLGEP